MNYFNKMSGGDNNIGFNNSVFLSERDTADRNFALAYFMKENKCFPPGFNLQETLDFYFQVTKRFQRDKNTFLQHLPPFTKTKCKTEKCAMLKDVPL